MKSTGKWVLLALTPILAAGLTTVPAGADDGGKKFRRLAKPAHFGVRARGRGFKGMARLARMKEALNLTDEQVIKLKGIFAEARKEGIKTGAEIRVARIEMRQLMRQEKVNRAAVDQKIKEISALREKMMRHRVDTRLKARGVLTAEQVKKAQALVPGGRGRGRGPRSF